MELENPEKFAKNFLEEFLSDSFGSKSKKEIELLIFKLLLQDSGYYKNFDRYKVSRFLKISDTKVVNMYKELQLRDDSFNEGWFVDSINQLISNAKLEVQSKKILLQVGDPLLKIEIEKFSKLAKDWWNPNGKFKSLHLFNPARIEFIKEKLIK